MHGKKPLGMSVKKVWEDDIKINFKINVLDLN
jgi:hypothetical protein